MRASGARRRRRRSRGAPSPPRVARAAASSWTRPARRALIHGWSTPLWTGSNSTRASDRSLQGLLRSRRWPRPFLPAVSRHRSSSADSPLAHHSSRTGCAASSSCLRVRVRPRPTPSGGKSVTSFVRSTSNSRTDLFGDRHEHDGLRGAASGRTGRACRDLSPVCPTMCSDVPLVPGLRQRPDRAGRAPRPLSSAIFERAGAAQAKISPRSRPTARPAPRPDRPSWSQRKPDRASVRSSRQSHAPLGSAERAPEVVERCREDRRRHGRRPRSKPRSNHSRSARDRLERSRWWCDSEAFRSRETLRLRKRE